MRHAIAITFLVGCAGPAGATAAPAAVATPAPGCSAPLAAACSSPAPSLSRDVQPILRARCFTCHSGDGVAAEDHDFSRSDTLWRQRRAVAGEIETCAMPPREPLAPDEAATLLRWVACGSLDR